MNGNCQGLKSSACHVNAGGICIYSDWPWGPGARPRLGSFPSPSQLRATEGWPFSLQISLMSNPPQGVMPGQHGPPQESPAPGLMNGGGQKSPCTTDPPPWALRGHLFIPPNPHQPLPLRGLAATPPPQAFTATHDVTPLDDVTLLIPHSEGARPSRSGRQAPPAMRSQPPPLLTWPAGRGRGGGNRGRENGEAASEAR